MRKVKLEQDAIVRLLDELDAAEDRARAANARVPLRFRYRQPAVQVSIEQSRDMAVTCLAPTRRLGSDGVSFLVGNMVHVGSPARIQLITIRNNEQLVTGRVGACRYLPGTQHVHEAVVLFDRPVDPASFTSAAIRGRVLVADDSPMARRLIGHMLGRLNIEVTSVQNGMEAVRDALRADFDLILMDVEMPELDGISAVRMLRSKGYVRPIVAISSLTRADVRSECLAAGCDGFLPKPPEQGELEEFVRRTKAEPIVSSLLDRPDMRELIDEFVHDLPGRVRRLERAFSGDDRAALAMELRNLRGEAGGFGFEPLTDAAGEVERQVENRAAEPGDVRRGLSELVRKCLAARPATCPVEPPGQAVVDALDPHLAEENAEALADDDGLTPTASPRSATEPHQNVA